MTLSFLLFLPSPLTKELAGSVEVRGAFSVRKATEMPLEQLLTLDVPVEPLLGWQQTPGGSGKLPGRTVRTWSTGTRLHVQFHSIFPSLNEG